MLQYGRDFQSDLSMTQSITPVNMYYALTLWGFIGSNVNETNDGVRVFH